MGTHLRVLSESYPMNTNITGFRGFLKIFAVGCFGQKYLSIGRVKQTTEVHIGLEFVRNRCMHMA